MRQVRITINHNTNDISVHAIDDKNKEDVLSLPCKDTLNSRMILIEVLNFIYPGSTSTTNVTLDEINEDVHSIVDEW